MASVEIVKAVLVLEVAVVVVLVVLVVVVEVEVKVNAKMGKIQIIKSEIVVVAEVVV